MAAAIYRFALSFLLLMTVMPVHADIRFVSPRNLSFAIGETRIEVVPSAGAGRQVDRIEIHVNDQLLTKLTAAPWVTSFDAEDGSHGNRVVATVYWSDGSSESTAVRTSRLRINQEVQVDLVNLFPIIRDKRGRYIPNLVRKDFEVYENDVKQTVSVFSAKAKPLRLALVLDISESMRKGDRLALAKTSALSFLNVLGDADQAMLVTFSDGVTVTHPMTSNFESIAVAIKDLEAVGGTALYDGLWRGSRELKQFTGRRVLVLLSDGRDESSTGLEPGSLHTSEEAIEEAKRGEVILFTIGLGSGKERVVPWHLPLAEQLKRQGETTEEYLERIAETTGGQSFFSRRAGNLRKAFASVADALRAQYALAYTSSDRDKQGEWRAIKVRIAGHDDAMVTCRDGYYAVPPASLSQ